MLVLLTDNFISRNFWQQFRKNWPFTKRDSAFWFTKVENLYVLNNVLCFFLPGWMILSHSPTFLTYRQLDELTFSEKVSLCVSGTAATVQRETR